MSVRRRLPRLVGAVALLGELPELQFALYDDAAYAVLAEGHTGPLAWDGDDRTLPDG